MPKSDFGSRDRESDLSMPKGCFLLEGVGESMFESKCSLCKSIVATFSC